MSTYTQILYQIIFSTHSREKTLSENNSTELYKYISGILKNKKCHLYRIVKNQKEHHSKKTFREEFMELLKEHKIEFEEKYLL